ncbi:hypothetical protein BL1202_04136 [Bacillus licheniformis]|jgi:hypothetical protein|nr:hypothetical protein BL1202_04136 [Bacillus licheniformis]ARC69882.1 hypothetical protein B34_02468 [Bacillus licheniformis]TDO63256.1 hypothetical protein DFO71_1654 [Bacillus licheniformis]
MLLQILVGGLVVFIIFFSRVSGNQNGQSAAP